MGKAARLVQGANQKQIAKLFDSFNGRYSMYSLWQDFVVMAAIAISNTVDLVHREEREKMYLQISSKYTSTELQVFAQILSEVVIGMEKNPDQDFLGEMYMALEMGNQHAGQFFTPYSVCKAMAKMNEPNVAGHIEQKHWISVNDCACGAGALLVAFANECAAQGVNYQTSVLFTAQDIDMTVACMCYIQLSLLGCAGYVKIANSITDPSTSIDGRGLIPVDKGDIWYTPLYFSPIWQGRQLYTRMDLMAMGAAKAQQAEPERCESAAPVPEAPVELTETYSADDRGQLTFF